MSSLIRTSGPFASADLRTLLRENFTHEAPLPAVQVPLKQFQEIKRALTPLLLKTHRQIVPEGDKDKKFMVLDPDKVEHYDEILSQTSKDLLKRHSISLPPPSVPVTLTYDHLKLKDVLNAIMPSQAISAFTQVGHIVHLNLKPAALPYRFLIGQAMLDKLVNVKTVVNKTEQINNVYRNFQLELLAGEDNFVTSVSTNDCKLHLDFSKVYWNTRLSTEHSRIIAEVSPNDVLYDVFAGIGPFAIPAARKGCRVLANDINPDAVHWLRENALANSSRAKALAISVSNMNGRDFLKTAVAGDFRWEARSQRSSRRLVLVMNLPAIAVTFLDCLRYLPHPGFVDWRNCPVLEVRCYCFLRKSESDAASSSESEEGEDLPATSELNLTLSNVLEVVKRKLHVQHVEDFKANFVRNVAVSKDMYRLDFKVTGDMFQEMLKFRSKNKLRDSPDAKKARIEAE